MRSGKDGPTDIDNGTLRCPGHHRLPHKSNHQMRIIDGIPHLLHPPSLDPAQHWQRVGNARTATLESLRR